tara:strand:- start:99 stop:353 length:255 start_codon:yes stop_codon:yes gene_type:complete
VINGTQIRAARVLLNWSQEQLSEAAGVSLPTIRRIEARRDTVGGRADTLGKIQQAIEDAGISFIASDSGGGPGVRLGSWPGSEP